MIDCTYFHILFSRLGINLQVYHNMKTLILLAFMSNMLTAGCDKAAVINTPAKTITNVAYGNDPKQVYDIYLPEGRSSGKTPVMFLFHAGSWSGGDKRD